MGPSRTEGSQNASLWRCLSRQFPKEGGGGGGTHGNPVKFQVCKTAGRPQNPDRENALKGEMLNLLCFRESVENSRFLAYKRSMFIHTPQDEAGI